MAARIDHLVVAATDLAWLCDWWQGASGLAATPGGAHDGMGSRNALVGLVGSLSPTAYLELIGPDIEQPEPPGPRPFGIDEIGPETLRLVTFAISVDDLDAAMNVVAAAGFDPGRARSMSRVRPDGIRLEWRLATPPPNEHHGTQPFLIEWGDTPHPSASLPSGCVLESLSIASPHHEALATLFGKLEVEIGVEPADQPMLSAAISTPTGQLELEGTP